MSANGHPPLDAMASEFVAEIKDDLASLEPDLLALEENGARVDDELINHAFRSIHSIKGGAGFIDFKALSSLSHAMENVLMRVREKQLVITSPIVDALLSGFDKMKLMVESLGTDQTCDGTAEKEVLEQLLQADPSEGKTPESTPEDDVELLAPFGANPCFEGKTFPVDKCRLKNALDSQKFVYAIHIQIQKDLEDRQKTAAALVDDIESIGDLLYSSGDVPADETGDKTTMEPDFFCVVSTILDLPLLAQVIEINTRQIVLVDQQFTDCQKILQGFAPKPSARPAEPAKKPEPEAAAEPSVDFSVPSPALLQNAQTIRVNVDLVSKLMNRAGELVLSRNQLRVFMEQALRQDSRAAHIMQDLDLVTTSIQEAIMQMRMQPVVDLLGKYKRVVRDIARRMNKKVDFVIEGAEVEMDRTVLEKLANPVTHLIRNSIDHGIEYPDERIAKGKPETGIIQIKAFHQGGHVHLIISDDGAGIDPQLILSKAFEKGLVTEEQIHSLSDRQKTDLIFLPGFSTSQEVTDISGRGVGMDVVKTNIERLRGQIEIDSIKGEGVDIRLIIPLTLAIVPSLIVGTGSMKFAIPQASIKEAIYLEPGMVHEQVGNIAGSEVLRLREQLIPILRLRNILGLETYIKPPGKQQLLKEKRKAIADRRQQFSAVEVQDQRAREIDRRKHKWDAMFVVLVKMGSNVFGLCVDELYDIEEVVVEPLSDYIKHLKWFAGATVLGSGDVIMVLDVAGIAVSAALKFDIIKQEEFKQYHQHQLTAASAEQAKDLIVFCHAGTEYFALELKQVTRIEPFNPSDVYQVGNLRFVEHHHQAVPLCSMDEFMPVSTAELSGSQAFAVFPRGLSSKVGILASKIVDTLHTDQVLEKDAACPDAVRGKLFMDRKMVQVLDHETLISLIENTIISKRSSC